MQVREKSQRHKFSPGKRLSQNEKSMTHGKRFTQCIRTRGRKT